jgi:ABC-type polysaccharide/polyol phosphate export permease
MGRGPPGLRPAGDAPRRGRTPESALIVVAEARTLLRYRALIRSLVSRELKARYRGSVLGFFWSFVNPVLLLLTYWLVFTYMLPGVRQPEVEPYFVFLFCGILPWTWFQSSVVEGAGVLIAGGNLIKKVLFPAEVLPVVTVLANMAHFLLGLPILLACLLATGHLHATALSLPVPLLIQLVFTLGVALLVSALTVHFRDIQNILSHLLHVWFFATPVLYLMPEAGRLRQVLRFNPMAHVVTAYQDALFFGRIHYGRGLLGAAVAAVLVFAVGAFVFDRLRDTLAEEV